MSVVFRNLVLVGLCAAFQGCALTEGLIRSALAKGATQDGLQTGVWTYWYENGNKKAQGEYDGDRQIGPWTYWHPNGALEWQGTFAENRLHGPSTFFFDTGRPRARGEYRDGFEEGLWRFWDSEGNVATEGDFFAGRAGLRWTYFAEDGRIRAEGYRHRGEKVGIWQFWDDDQTLYERAYPVPEGLEVVNEAWDGGGVRREGLVENGKKIGRWLTYHRNGQRRAIGNFVDGLASGKWFFYSPRGELLAKGELLFGRPSGRWDFRVGSGFERATGTALPPPPSHRGSFSSDEWSESTPLEKVALTWVAEASTGVDGVVDQTPTAGVAGPPQGLELATDLVPIIPLRRQPWTVSEQASMDYLVTRYRDGEAAAKPPPGSRYGKRAKAVSVDAPPSKGDLALSVPLMNKPLPHTRFYNELGQPVDLDDLKGEKFVVLVVLRGFAREICVYCVTQTEALAQSVEAFGELDSEIFVVYPGEGNRLEAFLKAFEAQTEIFGEIPIGTLYDPDLALVTKMNIEDELAIPSTFILDRDGIVRYAYVGTSIEDRPPAKDLLEAIEAMVPAER